MWVNVWEHYLPLAEETQFYSLSSFDLDKLTNYLTETTAKLLRMSMMSQKHRILLLMMKTSIWCGRGEKKRWRRKGYYYFSYTSFCTQGKENIIVLPVGDKLLSQLFRQFIRRAQTATNNKDM